MRILITWHAAVEPSYRKLFSELALQGAEIKLIVPSEWAEGGRLVAFQHDKSDRYDILPLNTIFTNRIRAFFYPDVRKLYKEISDFEPDIIHIMEEPFSFAAVEFMLLAKHAAPKSKIALFSFENIDFLQRFPYSRAQSFNLKNSDAIVVVPEEGINLWKDRGFKKHIVHIPIGIDTDLFRKVSGDIIPEPIKDIQRNGAFKIGYVGRVIKEKGVDTLIEAVSRLKKKGKYCFLYIVGNGDYKDVLAVKSEENSIKEYVKFIPALKQEDLPGFYSVIDALVLPSNTTPGWKEQFGRVIVEAMACEVPVIGSSSGEIPNVIGDVGLVFPEGDVTVLADCIEKLMEDENLRKEYAMRGKKRAVKNYSWKAIAKDYIGMYEGLISDTGYVRAINLGCGKAKIRGTVGVDIYRTEATDAICNLNGRFFPFRDNVFDKIYAIDVIEHLDDVKAVMEEIHRISKPGAEVFINVPHFSSTHAYGDFTHKHFFNTQSFDYFTGELPQYDFYSAVRFDKTNVRINFWKLHKIDGISFLANRFLLFYEKYFAFIFPAMNIEVILKVVK